MTFNKKIKLLRLERQNGSAGYAEKAAKTVWANVRDIGVTTKFSAAAAGREAEIQAVCHRNEFERDSFTHAEYCGIRYRIESTGTAENSRHIKLILAKGG